MWVYWASKERIIAGTQLHCMRDNLEFWGLFWMKSRQILGVNEELSDLVRWKEGYYKDKNGTFDIRYKRKVKEQAIWCNRRAHGYEHFFSILLFVESLKSLGNSNFKAFWSDCSISDILFIVRFKFF